MSTTLTAQKNWTTWQNWPLGEPELDYSATGAEWPVTRGTTQSSWLRPVLLVAILAPTVVTGRTVQYPLVPTGRTLEDLIDEGQPDATTLESWGELLEQVRERASSQLAEVMAGADLVADIKSTLGISVTDLATIARVSRQTIYDWIGEGQVSEANYERLLDIRKVCTDWRSRVNGPVGRLLRAKNADGRSLMDMLAEDPLDHDGIKAHLDALAAKAAARAAERRERNARLAPLSEKDQYENALTHAIPAADS